MSTPLRFSTPRLDLVAATATMARAEINDTARFESLLGCAMPGTWPPAVMADVQDYFAEQLEKGAAVPGWWNWYVLLRRSRMLIGSVGLYGQPDDQGTVTLGYSIVEGYEGQGYATEAVGGLMRWMKETGRVRRIHATTFERHFGSVRILEKSGFDCVGVSSEDAAASEDDRQGRGKLMLFVHEAAAR